MSIQLVAFASYLTNVNERWSDDDYNALFVVKALKGRTFNGPCMARIPTGRMAVTSADKNTAREWFAIVAAAYLARWHPPTPLALIPVPNSKATDHAVPCDVTLQAQALAARVPNSFVYDVVRWVRPMPSASGEEGSRDPGIYFDAARVQLPDPPPTIATAVLIDDVCTTGAHLRAVQARLSIKHSIDAGVALCAAYTPAPEEAPPRPVFDEHFRKLELWPF